MAWLCAGAALAAFALFGSRGMLKLAAVAVLAGGLFLALRAYPALTALGLLCAGSGIGVAAAHVAGSRLPRLVRIAALLIAPGFLLFASLGPADGLF